MLSNQPSPPSCPSVCSSVVGDGTGESEDGNEMKHH